MFFLCEFPELSFFGLGQSNNKDLTTAVLCGKRLPSCFFSRFLRLGLCLFFGCGLLGFCLFTGRTLYKGDDVGKMIVVSAGHNLSNSISR